MPEPTIDPPHDKGLGLVAPTGLESNLWRPADCPLCRDGHTPIDLASA